jgi:predicted nucleic acid-binding protein
VSVFVLDSNIVSFYMRKNQQIIQKLHYELDRGNEVLVGPIAYYEVKRGYMAINAHGRLKEFNTLCTVLGVGQLDNTILDTAAEIYVELRSKRITVEDADILTAAFCRSHDFTLVTNNTQHFTDIADLNFCDWA